MRKFWIGTTINVAFIYLLTFLLSLNPERNFGTESILLFAPIILAGIEMVIALFLFIPKETRAASQMMFAASGIVLLIGLAVCSGIGLTKH